MYRFDYVIQPCYKEIKTYDYYVLQTTLFIISISPLF